VAGSPIRPRPKPSGGRQRSAASGSTGGQESRAAHPSESLAFSPPPGELGRMFDAGGGEMIRNILKSKTAEETWPLNSRESALGLYSNAGATACFSPVVYRSSLGPEKLDRISRLKRSPAPEQHKVDLLPRGRFERAAEGRAVRRANRTSRRGPLTG
jgi:hypothetical protein